LTNRKLVNDGNSALSGKTSQALVYRSGRV
jgi:hypothetical protein